MPSTTLPDRSPLPLTMFQFTEEELSLSPGMASVLIPMHISAKLQELSSAIKASSTQDMDVVPSEQAATATSSGGDHQQASSLTVTGIVQVVPSAIEEG